MIYRAVLNFPLTLPLSPVFGGEGGVRGAKLTGKEKAILNKAGCQVEGCRTMDWRKRWILKRPTP